MAKKKKRKAAPGDVATNRQACFRYNLLDKWEAGIVLQGSEVKSLRDGGVQLKDAYAEVSDGEVWLHNMHIAPYKPRAREPRARAAAQAADAPARDRAADRQASAEKGLTLVPTRVYFKGPHAKVELALGKGKDMRDKRRRSRTATRSARSSGRCRSGTRFRQLIRLFRPTDEDPFNARRSLARPRRSRSSPRSAAQRVSSWRLESWSLRSTEDTWASTVFGEMSRRSAISLYM